MGEICRTCYAGPAETVEYGVLLCIPCAVYLICIEVDMRIDGIWSEIRKLTNE